MESVDRADRLEREGRFREAAIELERLPREARDPMVDVRVVQLRHRAFSELDHEPQPESGAFEPPPDLWPDVVAAPEVPASDLSGPVLTSALHHHGCLIVRGLIPDDECTASRADIDQAFAAFDARTPLTPLTVSAPWFARLEIDGAFEEPDPLGTAFLRQCGGVYAPYAPRAFVEYRNALERVGLIDVIGAHQRTMPVLSVNKFVLRRIGGGAEPAWHQDGGYLGITTRAVNLWLALSECGGDTERMGLDILPGPRRELAETGTHDAVERRAISPHIADKLARESGRPIVRPLFEPGDGILFDQYFVHRSDIRPLVQERYAIESWFLTPDEYPEHMVPIVAG
jgi:hypothetical protein